MSSMVESSRQFDGFEEDESLMNVTQRKCDIFNGKWVYDSNTYPLYKATQCPFLSDQVSCRRNGRPDFDYEKWRWEPQDCEIPRFNGIEMLERLRGKRVIIAGDSINRNQWESLSCLLYSAIPPSDAEVKVRSGVYKVFRAKEYNCSIEFYWSPFLVQLDETSEKGRRVLKLDTMASSARQWKGADIMVFNTGHWWVHHGKLQMWDFLKFKGKLMKDLEVEKAFEIGMKTWAHWIDRNVDSTKTTVFFRSISPEHKLGKQWCHNQTQLIMDESYIESFPRPIIGIVEKTIQEMRTPVKYLNITRLSQYRKDAHPMVYTSKQGKLLTEKQRKQPQVYGDCSHWCLPGLPDTWNVLLYTLTLLENPRETL
ncbi:protein ESKIMO 1-like [Telopea speciosissima]|uniref:protein ESKIMO 1-like n=1 Tax=Telopea speciosissima TaxID=54955 RepID=UPI001CC7BCA0|nr:protein ESKIMO 1-like [Telopea speciosissima]